MADVDFSTLIWIEKENSPFGVRCLDCQNFAQSITSFTSDPKISERFSDPPDLMGEEYRGQVPDNAMTIDCNLTYACDKMAENGPLMIAKTMEDKWNIHYFDTYLYFSRSWTGKLVFRVKAEFTGSSINVSEICADSESETDDPDFITRQVDYLIKRLLLGENIPLPLPADLPDDIESIGLYSFSNFGRWAAFATYADTTQIKPLL